MEWIKPDININFVGWRYKAAALSGIVLVLGAAMLIYKGGLNMGIDFAGGTLIQVQFNKSTSPDDIRDALGESFSQSMIQQVGASDANEFLIRADLITGELESLSDRIQQYLTKAYGEGQATVRRVEMVGPKVGEDLRQKALKAIYYAMLFISIYIAGRFEQKWTVAAIMGGVLLIGLYLLEAVGLNPAQLILAALVVTLLLCWILKLPYALGAMACLIHDILITLGIFALTNKEFSLEVFAGLLSLAGYSLNDTIIVYDRIREYRHKDRKQSLAEIVNGAVNQTLSRTVLTSGTIIFVLFCLFFFGGTVIHDFTFAMLVGVIVGTYSSIFVSGTIPVFFDELTGGKRVMKKAPA